MKYLALGVCLIGMMAAGAYAQVGQTWKTDFNGTTAASVNNRFDQDGTPDGTGAGITRRSRPTGTPMTPQRAFRVAVRVMVER